MARDESLDDMLLEAAGRSNSSNRTASTVSRSSRKRGLRDSSSDDELTDSKSESDDNYEDGSEFNFNRRSSGYKMPLKKRFETPYNEEDEDEQDGYGSDLSFGSDLYKDDEDRARLAAMTELDREMILHDRAEARDTFLIRKRAGFRLKMERAGKQRDRNRARSSSRGRSVRDSSRTLKENALNELVARRQKAHDSDMQRRQRDTDSSQNRDSSPLRWKAKDSSLSLSYSDTGDEDSATRIGNEESQEGRSDGNTEDAGDKLALDDIKGITITRSKLVKWFLEPFFEEIIVGCFVRILIGISRHGRNVYRLCQVKNVDSRDPEKQYRFENRMTHKYLNCVWGEDACAARWQMTRISNNEPTVREFQEWEREVDRAGTPRISILEINGKKEAIAKLNTFVYSASLVKQMLQEKKMAAKRPSNIAAERDRVLKEIALADSKGEDTEVERLQARLNELEAYATQNQSKDTKALALAEMNRRNRYENFKNASDLKPVNTLAKAGEAGYDPFSRRWTRSQNYYVKKSGSGAANSEAAASVAVDQVAAADDAGRLVGTKAPPGDDTTTTTTTKLVSLHDFHLPISLVGIQKYGGAQGAHMAFIARKQRLEATCGVQVVKADGHRQGLTLTLNDYKRRRGLL